MATSQIRGSGVNGLIPYGGWVPSVHPTVFVAHGAWIIGNVEIGEQSSVWFNTVIRGDVHSIRIGARTNIQDNSTLHVTSGQYALSVGAGVTVGHRAVLHGCVIEDDCLIGMGAIVLDGAVVRRGSLVAAGSVVPEGYEVPEGMLVAGVPSKVKRALTEGERKAINETAFHYVDYGKTYLSKQGEGIT
ncbi:MAG: gamma carbonic anhydrase family protein [Bacteroidota bacterium]